MRSKKLYSLAAFITAWTFIAYVFLLRNSSDLNSHSQVDEHLLLPASSTNLIGPRNIRQKLKQIERDVQKDSEVQQDLIQKLLVGLKMKYSTSTTTFRTSSKTKTEISSNFLKDVVGFAGPKSEEPWDGAMEKDQWSLDKTVDNKGKDENISHLDDNNSNVKEIPLIEESVTASKNKIIKTRMENGQPVIPVLVIACNRVSISKCLNDLVKYRPNKEQFPIIVSQDCGDEVTKKVILSFKDEVELIEQPDLSDILLSQREMKFKGYYKISRHYNWALNTTFGQGYDFVIIIEDDLNVAPDIFEYFLATHYLLEKDKSLWCVSAWNDNGKLGLIDTSKSELLYRSDFFPGLGWMLSKELWNELSPKWPKSFWDDWIRQPVQRKDRVCIRPEISRTRTFGKIGVSNGLFFDKYLKYIKLGEEYVHFTDLDLDYLLKDNYDKTFVNDVYTYPIVSYDELRRNLVKVEGPVRMQYNTREQYKKITKMLGLMDDFKSGVPRTAYHGIVSFFFDGRRVHLAPNVNWKGYDLSWS